MIRTASGATPATSAICRLAATNTSPSFGPLMAAGPTGDGADAGDVEAEPASRYFAHVRAKRFTFEGPSSLDHRFHVRLSPLVLGFVASHSWCLVAVLVDQRLGGAVGVEVGGHVANPRLINAHQWPGFQHGRHGARGLRVMSLGRRSRPTPLACEAPHG